jgi:hypothetical protein
MTDCCDDVDVKRNASSHIVKEDAKLEASMTPSNRVAAPLVEW